LVSKQAGFSLHARVACKSNQRKILERVCVHEGTTTQGIDKMGIDADKFRQGSFDRPSSGRKIGP